VLLKLGGRRTHWKSNADSAAELSSVDLSKPNFPRTTLYTGTGLGYPLELEEGQILVRACYTTSQNKCHRAVGVHWVLVERGEAKTKYSSAEPLNYSQPNYIRGVGFYWEGFLSLEQSDLQGFRKTGGKISASDFPETSIKFKKSDLETYRCDFSAARCLKSFVPNPKKSGDFQYDTTIDYKTQKCQLVGVLGWSDGMSLTPSGLFGVKSLSPSWTSPRHVVYMKFQTDACQPTDIQHIEIN